MNKKLFLLLGLSFQISLFSQGYMKGDVVAGVSVGFPNSYKHRVLLQTRTESFRNNFAGTVLSTSVKGTNPIALRYEYAIADYFGLGLNVAWWIVNVHVTEDYLHSNTHYLINYNFKLSSLSFGLRPNYHFKLDGKKGDLYIGCAFGLTKNSTSTTANSSASSIGSFYDSSTPFSAYFSPTIGYRRYIAGNFGLNFEVGFEKGALVQAGVVFRFRPFRYELPK